MRSIPLLLISKNPVEAVCQTTQLHVITDAWTRVTGYYTASMKLKSQTRHAATTTVSAGRSLHDGAFAIDGYLAASSEHTLPLDRMGHRLSKTLTSLNGIFSILCFHGRGPSSTSRLMTIDALNLLVDNTGI